MSFKMLLILVMIFMTSCSDGPPSHITVPTPIPSTNPVNKSVTVPKNGTVKLFNTLTWETVILQNDGIYLLTGLNLRIHHYNGNGDYTRTSSGQSWICRSSGCSVPLFQNMMAAVVKENEAVEVQYTSPPWEQRD